MGFLHHYERVKLRLDDCALSSAAARRACSAAGIHFRQAPPAKSHRRDSGGNRSWAGTSGASSTRIVVPSGIVKASRTHFEFCVLDGLLLLMSGAETKHLFSREERREVSWLVIVGT